MKHIEIVDYKKLLDARLEAAQESPFRAHLGASSIGKPCLRCVWYQHRWAKRVTEDGRKLRLLERGHLEELRVVKWLQKIGARIVGTQVKAPIYQGHFGGTTDAIIDHLPGFTPTIRLIGEFKTHNEKNFKVLTKATPTMPVPTIELTYPEHYAQATVYMQRFELSYALYVGVCKNNDDLYFEIVPFNADRAAWYLQRAELLLWTWTDEPPARISSDPTWYQCQWCKYHGICHDFELPSVNCRTCLFSRPAECDGAAWYCARYQKTFFAQHDADDQIRPRAYSCHVYKPALLHKHELQDIDYTNGVVEYALPDGSRVLNGPGYVASAHMPSAITEFRKVKK